MARREINPIGLSFLDAMTCGFGAVILFFMVINAAVESRVTVATVDRSAEADLLEVQVLQGQADLVELRNSLQEVERRIVEAGGLSTRLLEELRTIREELATFQGSTLARREHINQLQADLRSLEEDARRLSGGTPSREVPGDRMRAFVGDGDRQYLTGLKVGGSRILILLDSSASMLAGTLVNIIRFRNLPPARRLQAAKWRQAVSTVDWLATQLPRDSEFQVYTFAEEASPAVAGTAGRWLDAGDAEQLEAAVTAVRGTVPEGGTSLRRGLAVIREMSPPPDNVILLVDSLPTRGSSPPKRRTVSGKERLRLFEEAVGVIPGRMPVNVILFPMEGDPMAASAYWKLAIGTGGSFLTPSEDWP
jgi:hypothetical protein